MIWSDLTRFDLISLDLIRLDLIWFDLIWIDLIWSDLVVFISFHFISSDLIWLFCCKEMIGLSWSKCQDLSFNLSPSLLLITSNTSNNAKVRKYLYNVNKFSKRVWKLNCKWPFFIQYNGILETLIWLIMRNTLSFSNWKWVFKIKDIAI